MRVKQLSSNIEGTIIAGGLEPKGDYTDRDRKYFIIRWDDGSTSNEWMDSEDLQLLNQ